MEQEKTQQLAKGEYRVEHLRPKPEFMAQFMPLWDARTAATLAGDEAEVQRLTAEMRQFQENVGEVEVFSNLITTVGRNDLLDKYLKAAAYTQTVRMGLKGTGVAVIADTQVSHASWLEQGLANARGHPPLIGRCGPAHQRSTGTGRAPRVRPARRVPGSAGP